MKAPQLPCSHKCIAILWPSFLISIAATGIFFAMFHPEDLLPWGSDTCLTELGVYTLGFFAFWIVTALTAGGTLYFAISNCRYIKEQNSKDEED